MSHEREWLRAASLTLSEASVVEPPGWRRGRPPHPDPLPRCAGEREKASASRQLCVMRARGKTSGERRSETRSFSVVRARELREDSTDAERALWWRLRSRQLLGVKFRRQHPICLFVVDFVAVKERLAVELDGGHHARDAIRGEDSERTRDIESHGYRMLRFWNTDVLLNVEGVLETIAQALRGE
ncbi:MAG: DUF559 domain-containing protein [Acidobacteriota bacterium]